MTLTLGMVQDEEAQHFSSWVFNALKMLEDEDIEIIIVGGAQEYRRHAAAMRLVCPVTFVDLPKTRPELDALYSKFDIFIHGSHAGETNFEYLYLAQEHGVPIVSHFAADQVVFENGKVLDRNAHFSIIGESGVVHGHYHCYIFEIWNLLHHEKYREWRSKKSRLTFEIRNPSATSLEKEDWLDEWMK